MSKTLRQAREEAAAVLREYSLQLELWRQQWSDLPPDRQVHLNAWAAARRRATPGWKRVPTMMELMRRQREK